jgi:vancomycin resistance protein YoaR
VDGNDESRARADADAEANDTTTGSSAPGGPPATSSRGPVTAEAPSDTSPPPPADGNGRRPASDAGPARGNRPAGGTTAAPTPPPAAPPAAPPPRPQPGAPTAATPPATDGRPGVAAAPPTEAAPAASSPPSSRNGAGPAAPPGTPPPGAAGGARPPSPSGSEATVADGTPAAGASRPGQPRIFDLPDHEKGRRPNGDKPLVLGGAAAAEGRTTGPQPRIAGAAPPDGDDDAEGTGRGRHFLQSGGDTANRLPAILAAIPVVVLVVLLGAWAIDTAALSGQVMRNVQVAGRDVGGLGEASLPEVMDEVNDEVASRSVIVTSGDRRYETTAGEIGLTVDTEATAQAALDAGRDDSLLTRPFAWVGSFFGERDVPVQYSVKESQVVAKMLELQGPELLAPHDPTIQLVDGAWAPVPGTPGQGVDTDEIAAELPTAAADGDVDAAIEVETSIVEVAPRFTDADAQALADQANALTANGLTLTAGDASKQVDAETLRGWITPTAANGALGLAIVPDAVNQALPQIFSDVSAEPKNASFDLQNGVPVVVPSQQGIVCCGPTSPDLVWQAISGGTGTAALEVQVTEPEITTETAQGLGITQPVGGNNAWRNGAATTAGPGFTTYHDAGQPRVTNIHRIADIVRGTVILPGETFSMNAVVGQRTAAKGFVEAGAIREGQHVEEIGGGVSQFATTTFNAAYFAGLDIPTYQAHSESFPRYPPGREATMGYPAPDLKITNNTPYGVMIWTSYTANSITVTLYSTPYATGEQTGISESMSGACRNVTTTRTRTFPDGHQDSQQFKATYRPGEGQTC